MTGLLKPPECHERNEAAHVQAVSGRIEASVDDAGTRQMLAQIGTGDLLHQPSPL